MEEHMMNEEGAEPVDQSNQSVSGFWYNFGKVALVIYAFQALLPFRASFLLLGAGVLPFLPTALVFRFSHTFPMLVVLCVAASIFMVLGGNNPRRWKQAGRLVGMLVLFLCMGGMLRCASFAVFLQASQEALIQTAGSRYYLVQGVLALNIASSLAILAVYFLKRSAAAPVIGVFLVFWAATLFISKDFNELSMAAVNDQLGPIQSPYTSFDGAGDSSGAAKPIVLKPAPGVRISFMAPGGRCSWLAY